MNDSRSTADVGGRADPPTLRLVFAYVAVFAMLGVQVPFVPVWLDGRGFDGEATGAIVAGAIVVRAVLAPLAGSLADRGGRLDPRRSSLVLLALAAVALGSLHGRAGFVGAWLGVAVLGGAHGAVIPLLDSMVVQHGRRGGGRLDYGRIRLWGSLAFLLVCVGVGGLLEDRSSEWVLAGLWLALAASAAAVLALPSVVPEPGPAPDAVRDRGAATEVARGLLGLLRQPPFAVLCLVVAALQGSHACYYAFSVVHWETAGIGSTAAAWLWAEGVAAEIVLFAWAGRRLRARPTTLFAWAALAAVVRWSVLASTTAPWALVAVQWMHAMTFGLTHLGVIRWLAAYVPDRQMSGAQTFVAAVATGLGIGAMTWVSGFAYQRTGGGAFWWMAAMGGLALVLVLWLRLLRPARPLEA